MTLEARLRQMLATGGLDLPLPARGKTSDRLRALLEIGREDLSLARVAEAHTDAVAILAEAGREAEPGMLYGVWASETARQVLHLDRTKSGFTLSGDKMFCTGAKLIDRALVAVCSPEQQLIEVNLRANCASIHFDSSSWITTAFAETHTATATFNQTAIASDGAIERPGWYLERPGFWHGACGPASCWAGGAIGLVDYARKQSRSDPHTLAHLGGMTATAWGLESYLDTVGRQIDADPCDVNAALRRALIFRSLVEQSCSEVLRRLVRAHGPRPLAFDPYISRHYQELELYILQSHAERDLEMLGNVSKLTNIPAHRQLT
jgi:alkylation response protein AidB-like acyl-CoA dehydrogenase